MKTTCTHNFLMDIRDTAWVDNEGVGEKEEAGIVQTCVQDR